MSDGVPPHFTSIHSKLQHDSAPAVFFNTVARPKQVYALLPLLPA